MTSEANNTSPSAAVVALHGQISTGAAERPNPTTNIETALVSEEPEDDSSSERVESIGSSTFSLNDSVLSYRIENGRTYHRYKDGKYLWPNDERENNRLDIQHHMLLLTFDGQLGTAPPNSKDANIKAGRVLDIGTGSGIWAMDFADEHPEAEVLGVDLSAIQPAFTPPNVKFEIDDIEEPWTYSRPFDYIHSRMMNGAISNWKKHIQNCYDHLNPNGYFELTEGELKPMCDDDTLKDEHAIVQFVRLWEEAAAKLNHPFQDIRALADVLAEVGFVDVHVQMFKWPSNPWPKDQKHKQLGYWNLDNFSAEIEGFIMAPFTRAHGWSKEEVGVFATQVRNEMRDPRIHQYTPIWSMYGRKPTEA